MILVAIDTQWRKAYTTSVGPMAGPGPEETRAVMSAKTSPMATLISYRDAVLAELGRAPEWKLATTWAEDRRREVERAEAQIRRLAERN
jgi:hypothetical protein